MLRRKGGEKARLNVNNVTTVRHLTATISLRHPMLEMDRVSQKVRIYTSKAFSSLDKEKMSKKRAQRCTTHSGIAKHKFSKSLSP